MICLMVCFKKMRCYLSKRYDSRMIVGSWYDIFFGYDMIHPYAVVINSDT